MSATHIILDNLPSLCQKFQIWWKFDVVITKIILHVFFETRCTVACADRQSDTNHGIHCFRTRAIDWDAEIEV